MENPQQADESFEVKLILDGGKVEQLSHGAGTLALAEALTLDPNDPDDDVRAVTANQHMQAAIVRAKEIDTMRKEFIEPARLIIDRAQGRFMPTITALNDAVGIMKKKLTDWQAGKKAIADKLQKEAEDKARKEREETARREAAERAERDQREKEAREASERAEADRLQREKEAEEARQKNDPIALAAAERAARRAAEEKARQEETEKQLREENERKAREAALASSASRPAPPPPPATTLSGLGTRENWIAEFDDGQDYASVKLKVIAAICGAPMRDGKIVPGRTADGYMVPRYELLTLLDLSEKQIKAFAKAMKHNTNIPGMTARDDRVAVSRATKKA